MIVTGRPGQQLRDLDPRSVIAKLATSGYLIFRGFPADLSVFSEFVKSYSSRVTLDPARKFHGGNVAQKVDAGVDAMGLHLENGNSPFRPDLTWFFCERAATRGSQTTVCDGYEVWEKASESARKQFLDQAIIYERRVEEQKWKLFVYHNREGKIPMEEIGIEHLNALVDEQGTTTIDVKPDKSILYSFRTPAVLRSRFGSGLAWANSIFGPSYNYEAPRIFFADGRDISAGLLEEMRKLTDELTVNIDWQDGDIALIDNTRVMHGRRAIEDTGRKIYNALSYLNPALV
ncbi:TauD/TfdA family dioxygenase [Vitiosangium sp. GDMCC 1.1324]|uniref:TauD/TfdA family dioxygenase n=1 Tax=Vitiosangium sp. (strain GDMCC 1.1324) TaxID=2138576 RepID=UPI0035154B48